MVIYRMAVYSNHSHLNLNPCRSLCDTYILSNYEGVEYKLWFLVLYFFTCLKYSFNQIVIILSEYIRSSAEFYSNLCVGWSQNKTEQENKTQPVEFWSKVRHGLVGIHKWSHSALRSDQVCPELGPTWATDDQRNRLESSLLSSSSLSSSLP